MQLLPSYIISSVYCGFQLRLNNMNLPIFLGCFILLFLSPLCLGYTSRQAQAEKQKVLQIMHSSPDVQSKIRNTQNLVALYNRVSPYMPRRQRQRLDSLVARHTDAILVDGVPSQGGRKSKYATGVLSTVAKETAVGFFNELGGAVYNWLQSLVQGDSTTKKNVL